MYKKLTLCVFACVMMLSSKAQIKINEYSCSNISTIMDVYGQYEDWVEIYNAGVSNVNLTGYYMSDDPTNLTKWQVPTTGANVNAGSYQMVFCSGLGIVNGAQIHPSFKLTQTRGEWFILSDATGTMVDSVHLNLTQRGHARGRTTNGANTWSIFSTPTPNASNANSTAYTAYATKPTFSLQAGFYNTAQSFTITSPDPLVTIRYTTNGLAPTTGSTPYTTPLNIVPVAGITTDSVFRACAYSSNPAVLPSFIETNSYITNETTTMNVISVSGPMNNLFSTGGGQWVSYEFFDKNRNFIEEFEGRARRHGHDSWAYDQKGFKIYPNDESGYQAQYDHKYFNTSTRDKFDVLIFKAAASDNYAGNTPPTKPCHLRDAFAHTLAEKYNLDMDFRRYEPTIIYINGKYWGVYEIRERVDKDHKAYYYGQKEKNLDQLQYWGGLTVTAGSATGWTTLQNFINNNNMAIPANYQVVKDSMNIRSFIQYFVFNQYLVNSDWLNWNTMWWRARGSNPIKWRFSLWDCDNILNLGENYSNLGTTTYTNDPCDVLGNIPALGNVSQVQMATKLMNNPEFVQSYQDEWLSMLSGPFECTNIQHHFDSIKAIITPEMPRHVARWNATTGATMAGWQKNIDSMQAQITGRCQVIAASLADTSCFGLNPQKLKLNVSPIGKGTIDLNGALKSPYVWSALMKADSIYTLKATATAGPYWTFDHWEKQNGANTINPNTTTSLVNFNFKDKDSVVAFFKYFNTDSINVTFDVSPPGTGTINLDGNVIPNYPTTIRLSRLLNYNVVATPMINHLFVNWQANNVSTIFTPSTTDKAAQFVYNASDNIIANFLYKPPPPPPPPIPALTPVDRRVFVPNAFSPNGDNNNDVLYVKVGKDVMGIDFRIFDRWGKQVFNSNKLMEGWNGKLYGRLCDLGNYQYVLKVRFRDQKTETYTGDITLIK
jgi:gliding motility-associated-like protein